jgi:hypothetical protein
MAIPLTVLDAMVICGLDKTQLAASCWEGRTKAERMASDVFDDTFNSCMDKTFHELDEDFKTYSAMPANSGKITFAPGVRNKIKAFVQYLSKLLTWRTLRAGTKPTHSS